MIQKRPYSSSTKVNRPLYGMVKICVIIIQNVNILFIYDTLLENVIIILLITYQNKTKMPGKNRSVWFIYKKWQVISTYTSYLNIIFGETV